MWIRTNIYLKIHCPLDLPVLLKNIQLCESIVWCYTKKKFKEHNLFLVDLLLLLFFSIQTVAGSGYHGVECLYHLVSIILSILILFCILFAVFLVNYHFM